MPAGDTTGIIPRGHSGCHACGAPLPERESKKGRPRIYCDEPTTGRPCSRWARQITMLVSLNARIIKNAHTSELTVSDTPAKSTNEATLRLGGKIARIGHNLKHRAI